MINFYSVKHMFQAKHWFFNGWKLFKKKPLTWIFMVLIFVILMIIASNFLVGKFLATLLLPVLAGGIFIALDKANRDEPVGLESLFSVFKDKPVLMQLLTLGAIGVAALILNIALQYLTGTNYEIKLEKSQVEGASDVYKQVKEGSIFTGIVLWIWAGALFFGIPLVAIKREAAIPALKHSLVGSLMNIVPLLSFIVMTILLTIISVLPVGLGLFVFIPVLFATNYFAFSEIFIEAKNGQPSELAAGLEAMAQTIAKEEERSNVYVNREEHQETDLKKAYESIRVFRLIGMALVSIGVIFAAYTFYALQMGTNATGEVLSVDVSESRSSSGGTSRTYRPTFLFTDKQGEQQTAPTSYGSSDLNYPVGARVKINYDPDDYTTVRINSVSTILYFPLFLWFFGGVLVWFSKKAKQNVDENGVPPRKSVFLKEGSNSSDVIKELKNSEITSLSDLLEVVSKFDQDSINKQSTNENAEKDEIIELVLPKKFTLDLYDEYMHITMSWFGNKTFKATLFATFYIGVYLVIFSDGVTGTGHPIAVMLMPWLIPIFGIGLLYYALTTWFNKTHIFVSQNTIEVKHKPLPWFGNKRIMTKNIKQLYSKRKTISSSNNRTSVYFYLHVISFDEDDLTLLKFENSSQALFLEQQIEKYLGIKNMKVRGEIG